MHGEQSEIEVGLEQQRGAIAPSPPAVQHESGDRIQVEAGVLYALIK